MSRRPPEFEQPLCAEVGDFYFYLEDKNERGSNSLADYSIAKSICNRCPHKAECADWGIRNEAHGVWGGLTPKERAHIRTKLGLRPALL